MPRTASPCSNFGEKCKRRVREGLPDGQISSSPDCPLSSPVCKKIPFRAYPKSNLYPSSSRPFGGALRNVTDAGRDAVDADGAKDEGAGRGRRSRVVLTPRRWRQVRGKQFSRMTVANKPGHRGEHEISC